MLYYWYEIFLGSDYISSENWQEFFACLHQYLGWRSGWRIYLQYRHQTIHYYLMTYRSLPSGLNLSLFLLKPISDSPIITSPKTNFSHASPFFHASSLPLILQKLQLKSYQFNYLEFDFKSLSEIITTKCYIATKHDSRDYLRRIPTASPTALLSIDFSKNRHLRYKKIPKYLDSEKVFRLAHPFSAQPLLELDTFPYLTDEQGIELMDFDFMKHSLVIGGSGSGKSRFLSLFITRLYQSEPEKYKTVIIDPHDALKYDLGEISSQRIIDFYDESRSVDLFHQELSNINVSVELMLETFKNLIGESYNGRLERVLRHSSYLLLLDQSFTFPNLRRLLSDTEFRNTILNRLATKIPSSISHFFLTEFQELRSQAYNFAFAPIIAFIDEMQMIPVMNQEGTLETISSVIEQNFLTIFSLNRLFLGDKPTRVVAGLLMQQLFLFAQNHASNQHLFVIIDEVAIVENPILMRFLSEMRKYNVSVILAGQYFGQITTELRASILANTSNYYIFRVSHGDAELLSQNLQLKLVGTQNLEDEKKLFTSLKARECLVQINYQGEPYALFKAHTPNFEPIPNSIIPTRKTLSDPGQTSYAESTFVFSIISDLSVEQIMRQNSTNRKPLNKTSTKTNNKRKG